MEQVIDYAKSIPKNMINKAVEDIHIRTECCLEQSLRAGLKTTKKNSPVVCPYYVSIWFYLVLCIKLYSFENHKSKISA